MLFVRFQESTIVFKGRQLFVCFAILMTSSYLELYSSMRSHNTDYCSCKSLSSFNQSISGVARVAELGGQAGGKGLHQGGKRIREKPKGPTAYRPGV